MFKAAGFAFDRVDGLLASISATIILFELLTGVSGKKKLPMALLATATFFLIIGNSIVII